MQQTTNYKFNKIQLSDSPADITVLNTNWDTIDTQLKKLTDEKFNKTGGEVSGKVTITKNGLKVTGGSETDAINVTGNGEVGGTLTVSDKVTANGGLDVAGGIVNDGEYKLKVDITKGQTPSEAKFATIGIYDNSLKEGYRLGRVQYGISTNNTASIAMYVNRPNDAESEDPSGILVQWLNGTTARISVTHHPETASNDKTIATTYWVRNLKATASQYGLTKLADETALLTESGEATLTVDKAYQLNDFRRMSTAYVVGDKVNCAFNFGFFLECTQAGTTSADSLDTRNVTFGQVITDGTVQWTVRAHVKSVNNTMPDANGNVTVDIPEPTIATEEEAKAGEDNTKFMTPLRVAQAIVELFPKGITSNIYLKGGRSGTIPNGGTWKVLTFGSGDGSDDVNVREVAGGTSVSAASWTKGAFILAIRIA